MLSQTRTIADEDLRLHLDNRDVHNKKDFLEAFSAWEASHGGLVQEDSYKAKQYTPIVCHKCHKQEHKAVNCRTALGEQGTSHTNSSKAEPTAPRCYSCGIVGQKSPDCPNRNKPTEPEKDKEVAWKKKEKQPKRQAMVSVDESDRENTTMATIYGQQLPVVLDTGAQMSVVPAELIPPVAHTGNKVILRSFVGSTREVGTVCVSLVFGDREWRGEVAMVNGK